MLPLNSPRIRGHLVELEDLAHIIILLHGQLRQIVLGFLHQRLLIDAGWHRWRISLLSIAYVIVVVLP